ncbi:MAG: ABC transporter ATP-binding protein/permease [Lactobacillales bacterium]|jgi:ATP-binding cassette subfamily B protein|nr:ABC transporter ATP-binding protein/permease [Lactobacillales bacterium]
MKVFKYLKKYWLTVIIAVLLLVFQANCDLSLPNLTSEIVDVGIMQGGVKTATPDRIRFQSLQTLELFMTGSDIKTIEKNYQKSKDGSEFTLHLVKGSTRSKLSKIFELPMLVVGELSRSKDEKKNLKGIIQGVQAGIITKDKLLDMCTEAKKKLGTLASSSLQQVGIEFVRSEYKALGVNTKKIQNDYMFQMAKKMIILTLFSATCSIIVAMIASIIAASVARDLRVRQFEKTLQFSNVEMDRFSSASLITRNTNDIQQIQLGLVMIVRFALYAPVLGLGGVYHVEKTKTGMSWIVGVAVGLVMMIVMVLMITTMPKFRSLQRLVDRVNLVSREILTGLPVIRAFTREKEEEARFEVANNNLKKAQLFVNRTMALMMPLMMLLMNGITVLIVWVGGHGMDKGQMQVGDMMAFITYTIMIVMAFMFLTVVSIILPRANVSAGRVEEVLGVEPSIVDKSELKDEEVDFKGEVKFEGVVFRFPDADEEVLHHINFVAKPGETTALIGSTGSGKSTIVNLIPRMYDVTGGRITIDGVDIRDLSLHKLHELMGFVPQQGILFSGDIASNIKFGDSKISDEDMKKAAEIAQATEFINQSKDGFSRTISQSGGNVSGGQKQRLSIARAIAKHPKILIFDDSFSALDNKTDTALRQALAQQVKGSTQIIVAQKVSTILHAHQIIVLNEGRIVGSGTHEELIKTNKTYQEIAHSQLSSSELGLDMDETDGEE